MQVIKRVAVVALVAVLGGWVLGPPVGAQEAPAPGITARGVGVVSGRPDTATLRIGVETRAETATEALAENNQRTGELLELLRGRGIADRDVQTVELSIWPVHGDEAATIVGYQVRNVVTARSHDIAAAGALLDEVVQAIGDAARVEGITFSIADPSALEAEARRLAVAAAREHAAQLADAAGVALGAVRSIAEVTSPTPPPVPLAADRSASEVALAPGSQEVRVEVEVVHDIGR